MRLDLRRLRRTLVATWDLLVLEVKVVTGNRGLVLAVLQLAYFVAIAVWQHFKDERWDTASFYNRALVLPGMVVVVALGMAAIMGERETRQLEVTFASPGGRYQVWAFRMAAIASAAFLSALVFAGATALVIDHDFPVLPAALHATIPVTCAALLTMFLSVLFNGAAPAALVTAGLLALSGFVLHVAPPLRRFDLFFNPLVAPRDQVDPAEWFRTVVFNRSFLLVIAGLLFAGTLSLLQRRERLL